jgi:hypothetical protein
MADAQRFPYVEIDPSLGAASALPYVPITFERNGNVANVSALVDSGAALSVLPYDVGGNWVPCGNNKRFRYDCLVILRSPTRGLSS